MGRLGQVSTITAADGLFSHADLANTAAHVASRLRAIDGRADLAEARVAFLVPPTFAHAAVSRGTWSAGGIAVPLAVSHPPAELEYVVRDAEASIVIASGERTAALESIAAEACVHFVRAADLIADEAPPLPPVALAPERRALIVYTSGTTGKPKGVVTTHGNVAAQIQSLIDAWEWTSADRALLALPLHHVHGIVNVMGCALAAGASLEMLPQFDAEAAWQRLASGEVTVFSAVPTIYRRLIEAWDAAPDRVRRVRSAGARHARLIGIRGASDRHARAWREITAHAARALRHDRDRHGALESAPRRAAARIRGRAAARRRGPSR